MTKLIMQGFLMNVGNRDYFLEANTTRRTDKVCQAFIERIGADKGKCRDLIERAKTDAATLEDFRRRIDAATLTKRATDTGYEYFNIAGKNFSASFPPEEFMESVVVF